MKRKTKKKYFKAASLLLTILFIVNTSVQGIETTKLKTNNDIDEKPIKSLNKNLLIGSGVIEYIYLENLDRFIGNSWSEEFGTGYREGIKGWIQNTDIKAGEFFQSLEYQWFLMIFPRLNLPKEFVIKDFTGFIYIETTNLYHGPTIEKFKILGISNGIQAI